MVLLNDKNLAKAKPRMKVSTVGSLVWLYMLHGCWADKFILSNFRCFSGIPAHSV